MGREPVLRQQAQVPCQICNDGGEVSSNDDEGYGDAEPAPTIGRSHGKQVHPWHEELISFDRNVAFTVSAVRGKHRSRQTKAPDQRGPSQGVFLTVCKPSPRQSLVGGTRLRPDGLGEHHQGQEGKKRPQAWRAWGLKRLSSGPVKSARTQTTPARPGRASRAGRHWHRAAYGLRSIASSGPRRQLWASMKKMGPATQNNGGASVGGKAKPHTPLWRRPNSRLSRF